MSVTSTLGDSPCESAIQPLHNPAQAAQVVVPQAPLGNVANQLPGMGAKALLAKKMAKSHNPPFVSPTDSFMTPVTRKLHAAKKKQFSNGAKPVKLFAQIQRGAANASKDESNDSEEDEEHVNAPVTTVADNENPF